MSATAEMLEKRLRFQFDCSVIQWKVPKSNMFASIIADKGKKVINLPPGYDDHYTLRTLFHELVHVAAPGELSAWGDWEEDIIELVAEPKLMAFVLENPRIHEWWLLKLRESGWPGAPKKAKKKGAK